ncbi:putative protein glutamine dumper [Helianthus annuus]|uniref:Uncharacterized protein n=1 Tax=Helianthus annuus TaxID=4232 RepID=A0A9K3HJE5_HELAN|nr:putative protein glutamine dumper [Helianthus annuus]KAJ0490695.1 putative protein glutamine dumper [Helianthus annuus]KAJ0494990.1 putative protein glutamine dumper [Helianthus annuus]KAJ0506616.1 putative protein glutamine dumper [Helianthus annuus]KAJ0676290.1 putative protein glutamine dumper [Helianthus annuus]
MTPTQNTTTTSTVITASGLQWNSLMMYLFGGMLLIFCLIACALIILAFSYKKPYSDDMGEGDGDKPSSSVSKASLQPQIEPQIVIIMPGDTNPTYLAMSIPPLPHL